MPTTHRSTETAASTRKRASQGTDATKLLADDHREVKKLFKEYDKLAKGEGTDEQKQAIADTICTMLTVHATLEEEIFYPAARQALDEPELLDEAEVEHASVKELIAQIRAMQAGEELFDAKVKVLGEYVDHHVKEEEGEMFPQLRKADLDLKALGTEIEQRKQALENEML